MASRPDSTKRVLKNIRRVSTVKVEKMEVEGSNTILLKKKIAIEKFLSNFRTAMAVSGEVKIFEATFPFEGANENELSLKVGDQCLVHGDGSDENAEWIYCEHENGDKGWCPRHSGVFLAFADTMTRANKMKLRPADGCRGVYGLSDAFCGLEKRIKSSILDQCLKTMALGEYEFTKELSTVIAKYITPIELRDTKAKVKLLEDPYVSIFINQYKDISYNHSKFYQHINVEGLNEQGKITAIANGLSKLILRFPIYETFLSVGAMTFHILNFKKKSLFTACFEEDPLPEATGSSKNVLNMLASPRQRYQVYKPLIELILRCLDDEKGNEKNEPYKLISKLYVETSKATAAVDLFLKKSNDESEVLAVQQLFVGKVNIFQKGRRLLHTDRLYKVHAHGGAKEQRIVHLFNDVIIYSIQVSGGKLQFRKSLSLLKCQVRDVSDSLNGVNLFDIIDSSKEKDAKGEPLSSHRTRFLAHSKEVKAMWMELIQQQTARLHERIEALNAWNPTDKHVDHTTLRLKEKVRGMTVTKPAPMDEEDDENPNAIGSLVMSPKHHAQATFTKSNLHSVALFLADFNGMRIQSIITEVNAYVDANFKTAMKKGVRFQPIFNLLMEHLKVCKSFVAIVCFFAIPLLSISRGLGDGLKHAHHHAKTVLQESKAADSEASQVSQEQEHDDAYVYERAAADESDSDDEIIGTRTSVGRTFEVLKRAVSIDQVALLHRPDVLVTLQTIVDLNQSLSSSLTELYLLVKDSDDSGDSISLAHLQDPFPGRLFESYAWSYTSSSKVLFQSGAFNDLIKLADEKLKAISGCSVRLFLDEFLQLQKYHIYIPHIAKVTPKKHKDYEGAQLLDKALTAVKFKIIDTLKERKNFDKLTHIQRSVYCSDFYRNKVMESLVSRNRKFIREGTIRKVCRGGKVKAFAFWLLSDLLIYATPLSASGKYRLNHTIDLKHMKPLPCTYTMSGGSHDSGGAILDEVNTPELKKKKSNLGLNVKKTKTTKPKFKNNVSMEEEDVDPMGKPVEDYGAFNYQAGDLVPGIEIFAQEKTFIALFVSEKERNDWMRDLRNACIDSGGQVQSQFRSDDDRQRHPLEIKYLEVVGMVERTITNEKGKVTHSWVDYELKVTTYGNTSWTIHKRYSMLLEFHKKLQKKGLGVGAIDNFPFPKKSVLKKTDNRLKDQIKSTFHLYFRLLLQLEIRPDELDSFLKDTLYDAPTVASSSKLQSKTRAVEPGGGGGGGSKSKTNNAEAQGSSPPTSPGLKTSVFSKKNDKDKTLPISPIQTKGANKTTKSARFNSRYNDQDIEATAL